MLFCRFRHYYIALLLVFTGLLFITQWACHELMTPETFLLLFNQLGPLSLIGIGLAVPMILFALIFGWVHLLLIMCGLVDPHLSSQGFWEALQTLFSAHPF